MRVYIQRPDLDTCLTALILGVHEGDQLAVLHSDADEFLLADPKSLCIEAGGSGRIEENNFDHHDPRAYHPPACRQALSMSGCKDKELERIVGYVCMVDERAQVQPHIPFPSLSNLFSGLLLSEREPLPQLFAGMRLLSEVLEHDIDPWESMPDLPAWRPYLWAKEDNARKVAAMLDKALFFNADDGTLVGYISFPDEQEAPVGGIGPLYARGCGVVVLYAQSFGLSKVRKFTIAGNNRRVSHLLPHLLEHEAGWGGRDAIIGSPRCGSRLLETFVLEIIRRYL